jgi:hypothetical protein
LSIEKRRNCGLIRLAQDSTLPPRWVMVNFYAPGNCAIAGVKAVSTEIGINKEAAARILYFLTTLNFYFHLLNPWVLPP